MTRTSFACGLLWVEHLYHRRRWEWTTSEGPVDHWFTNNGSSGTPYN